MVWTKTLEYDEQELFDEELGSLIVLSGLKMPYSNSLDLPKKIRKNVSAASKFF